MTILWRLLCVKDIVIDSESITKPRYSLDIAEKNTYLSKPQTLNSQEESQ